MHRSRPCADALSSPASTRPGIDHPADCSTGRSRTLSALVATAIDLIEGTDFASLSLITEPQTIECVASSEPLPLLLDWLQVRLGEGPSLDAIHEQSIVSVPDLSIEARWPAFAQQATRAGVGSMLTIELFAEDDMLAALSLYSFSPNAFTADSERAGLDLRSRAESGFAEFRTQNQLREALLSRDTIGQAKGILMERFKITDEEAFLLLARSSSLSNRKLRDIAADLTRTGALTGMRTETDH